MYQMTRRDLLLSSAGAALAFGLSGPIRFLGGAEAWAQGSGVKNYKVGSIEMMAVSDGVWQKAHDPNFIKGVSVEDTKKALEAGGLTSEHVPIPFIVPVAKVDGKTILFDAGTGGQMAPTAGQLMKNLEGAGITPDKVDMIVVTHFHPDHIFGLMTKDENKAVFAKAQLVMPEPEYKYWTDPDVIAKLPEARQGLAKRIQAVFPTWKERIKLIGDNAEVVPGIRSVFTHGHTPGHTAYHVSSGNQQLMISGDTANLPALFVKNPGWHAAFDQDGAMAEANRRKLFDRVVAEKMMVAGYHFPLPSVGTMTKDGSGYTFAPTA